MQTVSSYGFSIDFNSMDTRQIDRYMELKREFENCLFDIKRQSQNCNFVVTSPINIKFLGQLYLTLLVKNNQINARIYDGKNVLYDSVKFNLIEEKTFRNTLSILTNRFEQYQNLQSKKMEVPKNLNLERLWKEEKINKDSHQKSLVVER